jgi:hypothetical protein
MSTSLSKQNPSGRLDSREIAFLAKAAKGQIEGTATYSRHNPAEILHGELNTILPYKPEAFSGSDQLPLWKKLAKALGLQEAKLEDPSVVQTFLEERLGAFIELAWNIDEGNEVRAEDRAMGIKLCEALSLQLAAVD